ncbi:MAG: hypothetical protein IT582_00005, partial [Opitutaceae bacterium]|nr:hypothetical protein [Opitutaceae bacterium]
MRYATRIVALSIVALLLFLVGALAVQTWLNRQHSQIQAEAIAAKRVQFDAAAQLTADRPDRWSPPHLNAIGEVIQAHVQRFSSDMPRPPAGIIRLLQPIPGMAEGGVAIDFEMPHVARLSLLHGRTWGLLLVGCLAVMVLFIMLALATARRVNTETRTPWPATKTEMGSLEPLARASAAQG